MFYQAIWGIFLLGLVFTAQAVYYDQDSCNTPQRSSVIRQAVSEAEEMSINAHWKLAEFFKNNQNGKVKNYLIQYFGWPWNEEDERHEEIRAQNTATRSAIESKLSNYFMDLLDGFGAQDVYIYCDDTHIVKRPNWRGKTFTDSCAASNCDPAYCLDQHSIDECKITPKDLYMDGDNFIFFEPGSEQCDQGGAYAQHYADPENGIMYIVICELAYRTRLSISGQRGIHPEDTPIGEFLGLPAIVLHETTHTKYGAQTEDVEYDGGPAYGFWPCIQMAYNDEVELALKNADTFAFFALSLYLDGNYWHLGSAKPRLSTSGNAWDQWV